MLNISYGHFKMAVNTDDGMNLCELSWRDKQIITTDQERRKAGLTYGTPVLFPTPNRTFEKRFHYEGKVYKARYHGLVRKESFDVIHNEKSGSSYQITGEIHWHKDREGYSFYPFPFKLRIGIRLEEDTLFFSYEVENLGEETMPYGFGIHPFFDNSYGDGHIQTSSVSVLDHIGMINTGDILDVSGREGYDLRIPTAVTELSLDTVYLTDNHEQMASLIWDTYRIDIAASEDFSHMVIYTPKETGCFCVEPQTCAIDAMNLYHKGMEQVSGIIKLSAGKTIGGTIKMTFRCI